MGNSSYGGRNGMSSLLMFVHALCRIYGAFTAAIVTFINASDLTSEQKTEVLNWLNLATTICTILETIKVEFE